MIEHQVLTAPSALVKDYFRNIFESFFGSMRIG